MNFMSVDGVGAILKTKDEFVISFSEHIYGPYPNQLMGTFSNLLKRMDELIDRGLTPDEMSDDKEVQRLAKRLWVGKKTVRARHLMNSRF